MKDYLLEVDDPDVKGMVDILEHVAADPERRKELEKEQYYQEAMEGTFGEKDRELAKSKRETEEANLKIEEANRKTEEANRKAEDAKQALQEKDEALRQAEESIRREEELVLKLVKALKDAGTPIGEIAKITGLTEREVEIS
jgi:chromosome segregation ATPase